MCLPRPTKRIDCSNSQTNSGLPTVKKCVTFFPDKPTKFSHKCHLTQQWERQNNRTLFCHRREWCVQCEIEERNVQNTKSRRVTVRAHTSHKKECHASTSSPLSRNSSGDGRTYLSPSQKAHSRHVPAVYYRMSTQIYNLQKRTSQIQFLQLYHSIWLLHPYHYACKALQGWTCQMQWSCLHAWLMIPPPQNVCRERNTASILSCYL